ncbi:hypothetical protein TNIN_231111 [Trichonephila inaurata madagascariensis]|uniref:Uncharacterized protein n=1 Tax=Trichonephila inaurata madagascariensis TaxID=2747483 RepID=A0A8X6WYD8_9ARAC|nr:hypothetical protein TNIN_231111 [Trichonephila inaurata madagascariensis]
MSRPPHFHLRLRKPISVHELEGLWTWRLPLATFSLATQTIPDREGCSRGQDRYAFSITLFASNGNFPCPRPTQQFSSPRCQKKEKKITIIKPKSKNAKRFLAGKGGGK